MITLKTAFILSWNFIFTSSYLLTTNSTYNNTRIVKRQADNTHKESAPIKPVSSTFSGAGGKFSATKFDEADVKENTLVINNKSNISNMSPFPDWYEVEFCLDHLIVKQSGNDPGKTEEWFSFMRLFQSPVKAKSGELSVPVNLRNQNHRVNVNACATAYLSSKQAQVLDVFVETYEEDWPHWLNDDDYLPDGMTVIKLVDGLEQKVQISAKDSDYHYVSHTTIKWIPVSYS
jgi:hypothetical protein